MFDFYETARLIVGPPVFMVLVLASDAVSLVSRHCAVNMRTMRRPLPVRVECWFANAALDVSHWIRPTEYSARACVRDRQVTGSAIKHWDCS